MAQPPNPLIQAALDRFEARVRRVARVAAVGLASLLPLSFLGGLGACLWGMFVADAPLYLFHDGDGVVTVKVDGEVVAHLEAWGAQRVELARGDRVVELIGARPERWELQGVTGLDEWLIVTNPDLCFAVVDVGPALRGPGQVACEDLAHTRVTCVYRDLPKRDVGSRPIFSADQLPGPDRRRLHTMWLAAPCSEVGDLSAAELLADHLGCDEAR